MSRCLRSKVATVFTVSTKIPTFKMRAASLPWISFWCALRCPACQISQVESKLHEIDWQKLNCKVSKILVSCVFSLPKSLEVPSQCRSQTWWRSATAVLSANSRPPLYHRYTRHSHCFQYQALIWHLWSWDHSQDAQFLYLYTVTFCRVSPTETICFRTHIARIKPYESGYIKLINPTVH